MRPGGKFLVWNAMIVLILISFSFLGFTQTALKIMDSPSPVEALLGHNVTIPCVLTDKDQPQRDLDLSTDFVRWEMISLTGSERKVYLLRNGHHAPYRQNSNVEENEFKRGIASLTLYNVQKTDEGKYVCNVVVAGNTLTAVLKVEVSAMPIVTLSSYNIMTQPGNEQSVTCSVHKFYPEYVKIRWEKRSASSEITALDTETCNSVPTQADDGTFDVTSRMSVKPSSVHEDGDQYFCIVSHRSLKSDYTQSFTVTVEEQPTTSRMILTTIAVSILVPCLLLVAVAVWIVCFYKKAPEISSIKGEECLVHMKKSNLTFVIMDFKPKTVNVYVYLKRVNDSEKRQICLWEFFQEQRGHQNHDETIEAQPLNRENVEADNLNAKLESLSPKRSFIFYNCLCTLGITPNIETDDGAELTIQVEHPALQTPISQQYTLRVTGDCLNLSPIITPKHPMHGEEVTLTCNITKYTPGPLQIVWLKKDMMKQKPTEIICKKGEISDGRYSHTPEERQEGRVFSYSSSLTFTANVSEDHGKIYICRVHYAASDQNKQQRFDTYVRAVPVLKPIKSKPAIPTAGQQMELSCNILRFFPRELNIDWYKEDELVPHTADTTRVDEHGLHNVVSTLKLTVELKDFGKKFRCKVGHESLEDSKIVEWTLNSQNYFAARILAPECLKHGEEVTLTCDITKCDPKPLLITWLKEKQVIYKDGKIQDTRYQPTETRDVQQEGNVLKSSSSLTFMAKVKEDHGVKYTCKVVYSKIGKILKRCHDTFITAQPVVEQITSENIGQQMKLSCRVHSFHPKTIEIRWFKEKDELPTTDSEFDLDNDGLYSTSSILMYVPEMEDNGKTLRCQVDHQSLPNPEIREWKLEEQRTNGIES